jgi:hypothetical protein
VSEASNNNLVNLHSVAALQDVAVSEDVRLVPLTETDAQDILVAIENDPSIRERVTVASRMLDEPSGLIKAWLQADRGYIQGTDARLVGTKVYESSHSRWINKPN